MHLRIESLPCIRDHRGWVSEPLDAAALAVQKNVHVVLTEPGQVRGNHYHRFATEIFVVWGPALVRTREGGSARDHEIAEGEACRFTVPPGVAHAIRNTGSSRNVLVAFSDVPHDPASPDTVREVLIEPGIPP